MKMFRCPSRSMDAKPYSQPLLQASDSRHRGTFNFLVSQSTRLPPSEMPPPSSRMTKNRAQPTRYRPGKVEAEDPESEEESSEEEEEEDDDDERPAAARAPPPKTTTFPKKLAVDVSKAGQQSSRPAAPQAKKPPDEDLEGFVTASESSEDEGKGSDERDSGSEEESSDEEESSSDEEPAKPMVRPTFMSKAKRAQQQSADAGPSAEEKAAAEEALRKEKADAVLQAQIDRDAAARAAGKKYWDDEDIAPEDEVDDTDDLDPEAELAAWKLRELKRVRRERAAIEEKEKEREEVERRRNLTAEEREKEDKEFIERQKGEREEGRGKMGYMKKYFHKGAFFGGEDEDEEVQAALQRDLAGAKFEDEAGDKALLPEYMRVRDMTRLGKKGRSKYKDLKSEDTGRWSADVGRKKRDFGDVQDERFRPDEERGDRKGREGPTGANVSALGERKRARYE